MKRRPIIFFFSCNSLSVLTLQIEVLTIKARKLNPNGCEPLAAALSKQKPKNFGRTFVKFISPVWLRIAPLRDTGGPGLLRSHSCPSRLLFQLIFLSPGYRWPLVTSSWTSLTYLDEEVSSPRWKKKKEAKIASRYHLAWGLRHQVEKKTPKYLFFCHNIFHICFFKHFKMS